MPRNSLRPTLEPAARARLFTKASPALSRLRPRDFGLAWVCFAARFSSSASSCCFSLAAFRYTNTS